MKMIDTKKLTPDETLELGIRMLASICASISLATSPATNTAVELRCEKFEEYIKGDLV